MARSRKPQSAAVRFGPAIKAMMICVFIGGTGVGYVWQQHLLHELGRQKKQREFRLEELRWQNGQMSRHLAEQRSPRAIQERVRELKLGMDLVKPGQVVRIPDGSQTAPPAGKPPGVEWAQTQPGAIPQR
jgi:hypothetical protein